MHQLLQRLGLALFVTALVCFGGALASPLYVRFVKAFGLNLRFETVWDMLPSMLAAAGAGLVLLTSRGLSFEPFHQKRLEREMQIAFAVLGGVLMLPVIITTAMAPSYFLSLRPPNDVSEFLFEYHLCFAATCALYFQAVLMARAGHAILRGRDDGVFAGQRCWQAVGGSLLTLPGTANLFLLVIGRPSMAHSNLLGLFFMTAAPCLALTWVALKVLRRAAGEDGRR